MSQLYLCLSQTKSDQKSLLFANASAVVFIYIKQYIGRDIYLFSFGTHSGSRLVLCILFLPFWYVHDHCDLWGPQVLQKYDPLFEQNLTQFSLYSPIYLHLVNEFKVYSQLASGFSSKIIIRSSLLYPLSTLKNNYFSSFSGAYGGFLPSIKRQFKGNRKLVHWDRS